MFTSRKITTMGGDKFRDEHSVSFDGSDDYIETTLPGSTFDGNFTITAWIKNVQNDVYRTIFSHYVDANNFIQLYIIKSSAAHANKGAFSCKIGGASTTYVTGDTGFFSQSNKWFHVAFTYSDDNNEAKLYVNSVIDQEETRDWALDFDGGTYIGQRNPSDAHTYNSNISEVAVYDKALTSGEIKTLYNGREPYNHKEGIASGNLKAWYRMGDGTLDQKSNSHSYTGIICDEVNPTLGSDLLGGKGDFSDASYWTVTDSHSEISGGLGKLLGTGTYGVISKGSLTTSGKMYCVNIDCVSNAGASVRQNNSDPYPMLVPDSETGSFRAYYLANGTNFIMYSGENYTSVIHIDNVILREVGGNPGVMVNMTPSDLIGDTP
tara:strand:+ start:108 stop:1241 length:1134 start_codon:yes stop_codon:yes gene_type:complete